MHDLALRFSCPKAKTVMNLVDAFAFQCLYIGSDLHIHSSFPKTNLNTHILHIQFLEFSFTTALHFKFLCEIHTFISALYFFKDCIYLFLETGEGREKYIKV